MIRRPSQKLERLIRILKTVVMYLSFVALGMSTSVAGPTLLELAKNVGVYAMKVYTIYVARALGYVAGAFSGGLALDTFSDPSKELLMMVFAMAMGGSTVIMGWLRSYIPLVIAMAVCGIGMGALDTGLNIWCLTLWEESSPFFQALHFSFGIGAILGPTIAGAYLPYEIQNYTDPTLAVNDTVLSNNSTMADVKPENLIGFPYTIIGFVGLFAGCLYICLFALFHSKPLQQKQYRYSNPKWRNNIVVFCGLFCLTFYCGLEIGYGQMIALYAVKSKYQFTESRASYLAASYWGTFTLARGLSVFMAMKLQLMAMIFLDCILMSSAAITLYFFSDYHESVLWLGNAVLGFGFASYYPAIISCIEERVCLNHKITSLILVTTSVGEMFAPMYLGVNMERDPMYIFWGTWVIVTAIVTATVILLVTMIGLKKKEMIVPPERIKLDVLR